jgi:hypothetical protein
MTTFTGNLFTKSLFIITLLLLSLHASAQTDSSQRATARTLNWTAGFKLHNPGGITVKKYFGNFALELVAGRNNAYRNYNYYYHNTRKRLKHKDFIVDEYYHVERPWVFQLHALTHHQFSFLPRTKWYYGGGVQSRYSNYYFKYHYTDDNKIKYEKEYVEAFSMGVDAVLGIEYISKNFPLMFFAEKTFYTEIINSPLYVRGNISTGIRYTF